MGTLDRLANKALPPEARPDRVGPRVQAMRETLSLSRSQLADSIGLDRSSMTKVENGTLGLSIQHGLVIADRFGFGLNYLYRGDVSDVPDRHRARLLVEMATYRAR